VARENDADRRTDGDGLPGRRKLARDSINPMRGDLIIGLSADDQPTSGRINGEATRDFDPGGRILEPRQFPMRANGIHSEAVASVPDDVTVGDVKPFARGMTENFRRSHAVRIHVRRQGGNGLHRGECTGFSIVNERSNIHSHLTVDVSE